MDTKTRKAIEARLEKITKLNGGRLTPDAVVADARDEKSPLHSFFEWDDKTAAHQHRLDQARTLIKTVKVEYQTDTRVVSTVRYVRDPSAGEAQGYVEVAKLRDDKSASRDLLDSEFARVMATLERAIGIAEALDMNEEIAGLLAQITALRGKLNAAA